jgi:hypothetical protein
LKPKSEYTEEDERALRDLEKAMDAIKKSIGGKQGEALEKKYAEEYNKCYRMGLKQYKLQWKRLTKAFWSCS